MTRTFSQPIRFQTMHVLTMAAIALAGMSVCSQTQADQWSQFRGDQANGVAETSHPAQWSETENVAWVHPMQGEGWSCPVVWDDRIFLTEAVPSETKAESDGDDNYRAQGKDPSQKTYQWQVVCLDSQSGNELWRKTAREGRPVMERHSSNTYATETPVTDGKHVYAYFGMMGVHCFDMDGKLVWQRDLGQYKMRAGWGTSSSPVLLNDKLFLQVDNEEQSFLVALDAETGEEVWRVARDEPSQYSSPIVWKNSLRTELIVGGTNYRSYDPQTGELLWQLNMQKGRSSATPLAIGDRLYVGTEYRNRGGSDDGGGYLFAIAPGGQGEIGTSEDSANDEFIVWKNPESGIQMASPVLCKGHLYLLERRSGVVHCINADTGEMVYEKRIPRARAFWASPWVMDDQVFCIDTNGTTFILSGGPDFEVVGKNEIDELTWSTPAIADGALYFRTASKLYCIRD
ncbi:outer membrane protein assembly factor BamB family protein [Rhodopirellula baltica]